MNSIDRPLLAGLLCGLLACVALPGLVTSSAFADEDENELRGGFQIELQEQIELAIEEAKEEEELERGRDNHKREALEREHMERAEGEHRERENMEREHMERMEREHQMRREHEEREHMERMEREHQHRREHEERERSAQDRALDHEMRSLEIRRQHIELRVAEMELNERSTAQSNEVAFDAIKTALENMEPAAAAEFFADMLDHVESNQVKNHLRMRLAELYFKTSQPDQATKQLRMLIAP